MHGDLALTNILFNSMTNLNQFAREHERRRLENLRRMLATAPPAPRHKINANALRTMRALRNAPKAPTHRATVRKNARGNTAARRPANLNATLRAMHAALVAQKRQRALEHENRQLRLMLLAMPTVPRARVRR